MTNGNLSANDTERFENVRKRAEEMGVLDMNFSGAESLDALDCYEDTLDIIGRHKEVIDNLAGVKG